MESQKILLVIKIRFHGVQGSNLIKIWVEFFLKKIGEIVQNDELVFSLPYIKRPKETVIFVGADSAAALSQLDESFLRASLVWTEHITENGKWELNWDISAYDFSAGTMQKYCAGKRVNGSLDETTTKGLSPGPSNEGSLKCIEKWLLSNRRTKAVFIPWFSNI